MTGSTSCSWGDLPQDQYGPWSSMYRRFGEWQRDGTWVAVCDGLRTIADSAGFIGWDLTIVTTIARAHQHATAHAATRRHRPSHPAPSSRVTDRAAPEAGGRPRRPSDQGVANTLWRQTVLPVRRSNV
ncbi:transposase [Isoptericola jiangsuensis]|uniref:transposase n=1 Tax=Isoptericola jiangsuensis TaxID=548579 RepID=UPI003AB03978